jgi:3-phenylpropionate/trans-cinnamate dioxygenase ferredoxin component
VKKGEPRMTLIEIAGVDDIPRGTMKSYAAGGKQVLISNIDGKYYAIDNTCTHAGGDLSKGILEGNVVTCPKHGSKYDITTGKCISGPKIGFLKLHAKDEAIFEVKVQDNKILITTA